MTQDPADPRPLSSPADPRPLFSIVTAVHNVSRYLADFIESIEQQTMDLSRVEVIAVDDGSTDDSLDVLRAWQLRRPDLVRVLTKPNGGQGSARNLGLEHTTGSWVTFTDPDDVLDSEYLGRVAWAIEKEPTLAMVATNRIILVDETGELLERHPLRAMFAHRDQFKDLDEFPDFFHGSAPAAFFRTALIEEHQLRFDDRIQPNFEDGHFTQRYLLRCPRRLVAFLRSAQYHYRKRLDQTSTLQTGSLRPSRYLEVPRHGYLELLQEGAATNGGRAPEWLQNMIIYELSYYISPEDSGWSAATACHGAVAEEFVCLLRAIRAELDEEVIRAFTVRKLRPEWRQILLFGLVDQTWHTPFVVIHRYDARKKQALISYRFTGPEPAFEVLLRGKVVEPVATKVRVHSYFDHVLMRERLAWVSAKASIRVRLDGRMVELRNDWADFAPTAIRPFALQQKFGVLEQPEDQARPDQSDQDRETRWITRLAATRGVRRLFGNAWVLMDRVGDAGDNGERLFRFLRDRHPKINAWFVVEKDSPDWKRLRADGHRRLVGYGTLPWKLLMLNCKHLVSSHIEAAIYRPPLMAALQPTPSWRFTFLQHGVIKDDISGWLNRKEIDLFITSTPAEHDSIAGDNNRYVFTSKEVKRTGLPRFDRLRDLGSKVSESEQDLILVAPTWRNWLSHPLKPGAYRREVVSDFADSEYARNWIGLLRSEKVRKLCQDEGLRVGFLPHPNLQSILPTLDLPDYVQPLSYDREDVQTLFARAAVLVTDYSSVAFNAAYVDRPVVYFQFDRERVEMGGHLGRKGYFDYQRDGFGPVAYSLPQAETAVIETILSGRRTQPPYAARVETAFPDRDGQCCERVTAAIRAL
jgi:hypothetical protein